MNKWIFPVLFLAIFSASFIFAAPNQWTALGPFGGYVFDFEFHPANPSIIFSDGYRSIDAGSTWEKMDFAPQILKIHRNRPYQIYAIAYNSTLFRSSDRGKTWQKISNLNLSPELEELDFEVNPANSDILYIALKEFDNDGQFFKSVDGGKTWLEKKIGLTEKVSPQVEVDPVNGTLYLLAKTGTYVSKDAGESWTFYKRSVVVHPWSSSKLVIDPFRPSVLYLNEGGRLFRTKTRAQSWEKLGFENYKIDAVSTSPDGAIFLASGQRAFRSVDDGASFAELPTLKKARALILGISVHPLRSNLVFVGAEDHGVQRSTDFGNTWKISNHGMRGIGASSFSISSDGKKFLANGANIWSSNDTGKNWSNISKSPDEAFIHPTDPNLFVIEKGHIKISNDAGNTWRAILPANYGGLAYFTVLDPRMPKVIYASIYVTRGRDINPAGLIKTTDQGATWKKMNNGLDRLSVQSLVVSKFDSNLLMSVVSFDIYKSTNGGANWKKVHTGSRFGSVYDDPLDPNRFYLLTDQELLMTRDTGDTWIKRVLPPNERIRKLVVDPFRKSTLYALGSSIYISTDYGKTWSLFDQRGPAQEYGDFKVSPTDPNIFYAAGEAIFYYNRVVIAGGPIIEQTFPNPVMESDTLTIVGRNFGSSPGTVQLGKNILRPISWSPEKIVVSLSADLRTAPIQITKDGKRSNRPEVIILPRESDVLPHEAPSSGGTRVVIHWKDPEEFHSGQVLFGNSLAHSIHAIPAPAGSEGIFFICTSPPGTGTVPIVLDGMTLGNFTYR